MNRRQLFKALLEQWTLALLSQKEIDEVRKDNIFDALDVDDLSEAISQVKSVGTDCISNLFFNKMDSLLSEEALNEDVDSNLNYLQAEVEQYQMYCYKEFVYCSTNGNLQIITSSKIKESGRNRTITDTEWKVLELIFLKNYTTPNFITRFIQDVQNKNCVYVLTNLHESNVWRLYAYAYLCHINITPLAIPTELKYPSTNHFAPSIPYKGDVKYEQYFDAYHVMNESKHVNDLLNRYLRMYQILELFVYRNILAKMVDTNSRNSAFVRKVIKYSNKYSNDEKEQFSKGFETVFNGIENIITKPEIASYNDFLDNTYMIKEGEPHTAKKIGRIIYSLRNSVVHNKESELHFTFGNVSEYQSGIGLIRLIIEKMENEIVEKMNMPGSPIEYPRESMPLY